MLKKISVAEPEPAEPKLLYLRPRAGNIFYINIYCSQFGGRKDEEKPPLRHISYGTTVIHSTVSGNI